MTPAYTFMSKSTAKPGKLDDLVRITSAPPRALDDAVEGVVAWQVSVDRERNTVVVWTTCRDKAVVYDYLATDAGKANHGDEDEMAAIIDTFEMFDLTPVTGRLPG
ncbi:MAG: hypothetical protein KDK28_14120 [Maritimibacter sp.]|nr:hypothetical protein [Maritimibacter sp.]